MNVLNLFRDLFDFVIPSVEDRHRVTPSSKTTYDERPCGTRTADDQRLHFRFPTSLARASHTSPPQRDH